MTKTARQIVWAMLSNSVVSLPLDFAEYNLAHSIGED